MLFCASEQLGLFLQFLLLPLWQLGKIWLGHLEHLAEFHVREENFPIGRINPVRKWGTTVLE